MIDYTLSCFTQFENAFLRPVNVSDLGLLNRPDAQDRENKILRGLPVRLFTQRALDLIFTPFLFVIHLDKANATYSVVLE